LFTQLQGDDHILYISPPCQPFSPAHTVDRKDDETNEASFFRFVKIIRKTKPIIVMVEQTSGLVERRDRWFTTMIYSIAELGFSVCWKVVNLAEYRLLQARKRLIVLASWYVSSLSAVAYMN
jgi:DNA (cytosine-5)-methyltransferase 1